MTDTVSKIVSVGDLVKHFVEGDPRKTAIGRVTSIVNNVVCIEVNDLNNIPYLRLRSKCNITKLTDEEAILYLLEKGAK